jgi:3-dehydroquinate synthase
MSERFNIEVSSSQHKYLIEFLDENEQKHFTENQIVIIDSNLINHVAHKIINKDRVIAIPGNEESKQFSEVGKILSALADNNLKRGDKVVVIGGGSIQDIATISTSLYMRGVKWDYYPTTLASMMDSCIGGKSSINLGQRKNLIGNFHPPSRIFISPLYIKTLSMIEISAGISEGVKICFAKGNLQVESFMDQVRLWREKKDNSFLLASIEESLRAKKYFIEVDEFDQKERQLLNFGHSFGHALESSSGYAVPHGIAVLVGMLAAQLYVNNVDLEGNFIKFLINEFIESGFIDHSIRIDREKLISALSLDKKNSKEFQVLILPTRTGILNRVEIPMTQSNLIKSANATIEALSMLGGKVEIF